MSNLLELEKKVKNMGWFSGRRSLIITLDCEFEGFYGKASETWESQVKIEFKSTKPDTKLTVTGNRGDSIEDLSRKILEMINNQKL